MKKSGIKCSDVMWECQVNSVSEILTMGHPNFGTLHSLGKEEAINSEITPALSGPLVVYLLVLV